ncbi:MAG: hypothetical protein V4550_04335 [Gemmatimonadota bacterium]
MPDDDKFDDFLKHAARDYNAPVTPPADAIWSQIERDVAAAIRPVAARERAPRRTWIAIGVGVAATLVLGVSVGRWSASGPSVPAPVASTAADDSARQVAHARAATIEHLEDAEVFLTTVRSEIRTGRPDAERAQRSRELLSRTRLLLGASSDRSPAIERLLEDLELMLAEIAALPASRPSMDLKLLDETMRQGNILPRIRATLPAQSAGT